MGIFDLLFGTHKITRGVLRTQTQEKIQTDWENVKTLVKQKGPSQLRQALIIADKSLDNALRDVTVGESMGERLKNSKDMFNWEDYQKIWEAHKLRNNLVHELNFDPPYFVINEAIENIKKGLEALGVRL